MKMIRVSRPNGGILHLPGAVLAALLLPLLLLASAAPTGGLPTGKGGLVNLPGGSVVATHTIDDGMGGLFGVVSLDDADLLVGPVASTWPGDLTTIPPSAPADTIESEWTSGGIIRRVHTQVVGAGQLAYELAVKRHDRLVTTALGAWPRDP